MPEPPTHVDLTEDVRTVLVAVAASVLENLPVPQVPLSLVAVRRFTPRKRRTAGAEVILRTLLQDQGFRNEVRRKWSQVEEAGTQSVADHTRHLIKLFLEQPQGWESDIRESLKSIPNPAASAPENLRLLRDELALGKARNTEVTLHLIEMTEQHRDLDHQLGQLRRENRRLRSDADRARAQAREANSILEQTRQELTDLHANLGLLNEEHDAVIARLKAENEQLRRDDGHESEIATARARLLLDTVIGAATGLRRELALPTTSMRPGDLADGFDPWKSDPVRPDSMGHFGDEPGWFDRLLSMPQSHLIVDGYNVSKEAFPLLSLAAQRTRLIAELSSISARFGIEVTCVFDGAPIRGWIPSPSTRRVRVRFSSGEIADDLIRRIVTNEPQGRVLVVVTTDAEIVRDVSAMGAYTVKSSVLARKMTQRS